MDIKLSYKDKGTGTPLIMLHGNGESNAYFVHQINFFSKKYRVIAIDTRGHGKTPRGTAPFTIMQFADDLYKFIYKKKFEKVVILGFSDGANIAMIFALKYANKVTALILNSGNLNPNGIKNNIHITLQIAYQLTRFFSKKSRTAKKYMEYFALMVKEPNIAMKQLKKIKCPTLVIAGTRDMIKKSHTKRLAVNLKNSELCFINGTHYIAKEKPKEFNDAVNKFLSRIK